MISYGAITVGVVVFRVVDLFAARLIGLPIVSVVIAVSFLLICVASILKVSPKCYYASARDRKAWRYASVDRWKLDLLKVRFITDGELGMDGS